MSRSQRYLIFAAAILVTGVISGLAGASTTLLLRAIEHLIYGYTQGPMLVGVRHASIGRRVIGPALGCALAGLGWWLLRRNASVPELNDSIRHDRPFARVPMALDALLQVLAVGTGASLGREQAPRVFAAAGTEMLIRLGSIPLRQRQILLASAAGAGLAAVYNVPAAGALFSLGLILRSWRPVMVLVAVATSCIATVTAWPVSHCAATFRWPQTDFTRGTLAFAVVTVPLAAIIGTGFNALVRRASLNAPRPSSLLIPAIGLAGLLTGTSSIWLPQMPGNGKDIILESLAGGGTLVGAALALALKPALTALFIRAGAVGGMLTPALATGVAMGSTFALTIDYLGGHASVPTLALIGGAAVLGITQGAPVFAAVFTAELTHPPPQVWVMLLVAAVGAQGVRVIAIRRHAARELCSVQMRAALRNSSFRRLIALMTPTSPRFGAAGSVATTCTHPRAPIASPSARGPAPDDTTRARPLRLGSDGLPSSPIKNIAPNLRNEAEASRLRRHVHADAQPTPALRMNSMTATTQPTQRLIGGRFVVEDRPTEEEKMTGSTHSSTTWGKRDDMIVREELPFNAEPPASVLAANVITPLDTFYARNHGSFPDIALREWRLRVGGLVDKPLNLTYDDLTTKFPQHSVVATLACAGNRRAELLRVHPIPGKDPWEHGAISTAEWHGVRLVDVLAAAGVHREDELEDERHVEFLAPDVAQEARPVQSYGSSIPLNKAISKEVLLAWEMNGQPLPRAHGGPVRVVVPGYIGARSVKWVSTITVQPAPSANYFQALDYRILPHEADADTVAAGEGISLSSLPLNCDVLVPTDGDHVAAGTLTIRGWALAGDGHSIERVDVSLDDGHTWCHADLSPAPSRWAWWTWSLTVDVTPGPLSITARAWKDTGVTQPESPASLWNPRGYGNNAYAHIELSVT